MHKLRPDDVQLIKSFEGLELTAYPDPGSGAEPYTIGYGHTGEDVVYGMSITESEAEQILIDDLEKFETGINEIFEYVDLGPHTFGALVSFAFNVGLGAVRTSTLSKRLYKGEDPYIVLPEELPRWVRASGRVLPGLLRRRKEEVLYAQKDGLRDEEDIDKVIETEISLEAFFDYYRAEPHQVEAVKFLAKDLKADAPQLLRGNAKWVQQFRNKPRNYIELPVSYQYQLDSETTHKNRMCFSSTNAMLVEYLRPGLLKGDQRDDVYLSTVLKYGDTTSAEAQVSALKQYGINAAFRVDGTEDKVKSILNNNLPVPVGLLHHGHYGNPTGGHWVLIVGFDDHKGEWICHDPAGRMNAIHGGWFSNMPTSGRFVRYPMVQFNNRWMVSGSGDGWFIEVVK